MLLDAYPIAQNIYNISSNSLSLSLSITYLPHDHTLPPMLLLQRSKPTLK